MKQMKHKARILLVLALALVLACAFSSLAFAEGESAAAPRPYGGGAGVGGTDVFRPGAQGCMEPACVHRSWDVHRRDQRLRRASGRFSGAGLEGFFREIARGGYAGAKCCSASRGRGTWITRCCAG